MPYVDDGRADVLQRVPQEVAVSRRSVVTGENFLPLEIGKLTEDCSERINRESYRVEMRLFEGIFLVITFITSHLRELASV